MLPAANLHLKGLYDSTVDFFTQRSPIISSALRRLSPDEPEPGSPSTSPTSRSSVIHASADPFSRARSTRESVYLREGLQIEGRRRCHSTCSCPSCSGLPSSSSPPCSMRKNFRGHDAAKHDHARTQADVVRLEERCKALEKTLCETKDMLRTRDAEIERLRRERERSSADRRRSDDHRPEPDAHELHNTSRRSQSSSRRSHDSQRSEQQVQVTLPIRNSSPYMQNTEENRDGSISGSGSVTGSISSDSEEERAHVRGLETFLTKVDRWSGAQIIQALQDLNSEILQFAASATELCTFDKYSRSSPTRTAQATKETASRLGSPLARVLSSRDHTQDPILVQLALQSCVATCIARAMSTFCFGFAAKPNAVLSQIYSQMYLSEVQSTSSRWRALTHRHIQELHPRLEEFAVNDLVEIIFRWSSDIFIISGCSNPQKASCSLEGLRARFGTQVRRIANAVYKLAKITREEIMSTNFDVVAIEHGQSFDRNEMTDAFEDYGTSMGAVLCTTDLGLSCSARKSTGGLGQDGYVERRLLLRPKVVLESVADVLDPR